MAKLPNSNPTPERPKLGQIAEPDDPFNPQRAQAQRAAPFTNLLLTEDSILRSKGGIENLKIYRELLRDDQVSAAWGQRRLALTSAETVVEAGAEDAISQEAAEALQLELDALVWDDVTDKMLFSVFYGWGVAEIMWRPEGDRVCFDRVVVRERSRFRFDREGTLYLYRFNAGWVTMPDRKMWTVTTGADNHDEPYGIGLAHALYWPVFFKRNDIKFWLIFLEKFGMPTAIAKLPPGQIDDPEQRSKAVAMLRQISTDAGVVVPDNVVVELLEAARGGAADYASLHDAMNAAISKIIVGQTMTVDNGSSRSQAEVHSAVKHEITEADSDLLCASFNAGPVKWWCEWNFPGATPPRVYRHTEPPEDLNARAERDGKIMALGYEPEEEYIRETYGEGWKKKQAAAVDPLTGIPMPGAQPAGAVPGRRQDPEGADDEQFAEEGALAALAALRAARRGDQQSLVDAANAFASQFETLTARRVGQLLQAAEFADGDADLFIQRLDEILAEKPPPETVAKLERGSIFARLMGALRAQRRA